MSGASPASTRTEMVVSNSLEPMYWMSMPVASSNGAMDCSNFTWSSSVKGPSMTTTVPENSPPIARVRNSAPVGAIKPPSSIASSVAAGSSAGASVGSASSAGASVASGCGSGVVCCCPPQAANTTTKTSVKSNLRQCLKDNMFSFLLIMSQRCGFCG